MCGLCGNFDGVQNNDLTGSSLQVEEDPVDFGNSWKVSPQCADTRKVSRGLRVDRGWWWVGLRRDRGWGSGPPGCLWADCWGTICLLPRSPGATGHIPGHLPQQRHEADDGGFLLQDPYQRHFPGLQQAGEGSGHLGAGSTKGWPRGLGEALLNGAVWSLRNGICSPLLASGRKNN